MKKTIDWVVIGRFGRAHGVKGLITVHSFTEPRDNVLRYTDWHIQRNNQWQPVNLLRVDVTDKQILALVEGCSDREQAASLTNLDIAVSSEQLPELPSGDYYWHQLMGLQVMNQQGVNFGTVTDMMPTGSNDVMVIHGENRHLIPYIPGRYVVAVDLEKHVILVDWDADF
ncbi:ribosome maturation factor RimM [Legionella taurinensis]|uniref:Ribosome maturation factor RimM n=1 Tax=Legionella taurinensis TaxID=70611 RepID=A0A3A5L6W2_9GAMM|nr:ribosome maturation factor RimM [Legionella taurinensis]MDX1838514.1 ribosome maturation factor RimM [Legionella taurinensis]PUT38956.1 ribosome maturation factor RimM [Legionella taurinensis]PUT41017.1 ribosome maturation factor RimM [Legionella taurinensis]PUT43249.1 ribosome maturation factor RimM [Legionella taurinensis]PUT46435.1 ribosome maturation factor RimM [Legionella taurinensis]